MFLAGSAERVHILIRGKSLEASMSRYLISRIESSGCITIHPECEITGLEGNATLGCVEWTNRATGGSVHLTTGHIFIMIGAQPNTSWLRGTIALDDKGFILTETEACFEGSRYATNVPGVFAVGDARSKSVKRVASAVGEGSVVVADLHRYLAHLDQALELEEKQIP